LEKEFRISIQSDEIDREVFASVSHLARFVEALQTTQSPSPHAP